MCLIVDIISLLNYEKFNKFFSCKVLTYLCNNFPIFCQIGIVTKFREIEETNKKK